MQEYDPEITRHDIAQLFPREGVAGAIGKRVSDAYRDGDQEARRKIQASAPDAALYLLSLLHANARYRDGDMSEWHAAEALDLFALAARGRAIREGHEAALFAMTEEQLEKENERQWAIDDEEDAIREATESGAYGRTHRYLEEAERWIYIRFGRMPANGRSVFGLAGEDTEDGPDEWKTETGGMTHEVGVCVLLAIHHPSVPGAYVVQEPDFDLARYGVRDFESYLMSVIPRYEEDETPTVLRIDGSPCTSVARDRTRRMELGSDGEYMIDVDKPHTLHALNLSDVYVSEDITAAELIARRTRGFGPT